jgi:hypothetical protein
VRLLLQRLLLCLLLCSERVAGAGGGGLVGDCVQLEQSVQAHRHALLLLVYKDIFEQLAPGRGGKAPREKRKAWGDEEKSGEQECGNFHTAASQRRGMRVPATMAPPTTITTTETTNAGPFAYGAVQRLHRQQ